MNSTLPTSPVDLGHRWHSTTFRWLSVYSMIFTLSIALLVGFIAWAATNTMERDTDEILDWQLIYFDSIPDNQLSQAIRQRLEHERMHTNFYGLFTADGRHVAGDVTALAPRFAFNRTGLTLTHALTMTDDADTPVVRAMGERRADGTQLVVARDMTHILKIRQTIINALVGGGVLCLAAGIVGGVVLSMRQMRRVREIRRVTQRIAQGDLTQRLPVGGRDELDMLTHLVNHMLREVERLMHEVKGACDAIAHDLRTPVAHVRTLLARVAEDAGAMNDKTVVEMITRARDETDIVLERFRAMLRISEIGARQRRNGFAMLDLQALISDIGDFYEPLAEDKALAWRVCAEPVGQIHGDRALLFEALSNLIDNAIKFTPAHGVVRMELSSTSNGPRIDIVDNGPGIAPGEREAVLQPFYRAEGGRHTSGSGLGLSIVSAIVRLHDFALRIGDEYPGTRLTIECWPHTLA